MLTLNSVSSKPAAGHEVEVADHKLPDIRIFRAGVGIVTIEVKVANKYSYNELRRDALESQLIGQYMRVRESRYGILLLVNLETGRTWESEEKLGIDFAAVVTRLNDEAAEISTSRGRGETIKVVGIDLS